MEQSFLAHIAVRFFPILTSGRWCITTPRTSGDKWNLCTLLSKYQLPFLSGGLTYRHLIWLRAASLHFCWALKFASTSYLKKAESARKFALLSTQILACQLPLVLFICRSSAWVIAIPHDVLTQNNPNDWKPEGKFYCSGMAMLWTVQALV